MTIKQRQWQLYYLGYYGGTIDGIWGPQSKAATLRFQKDHDLDADGIFGDLTIARSVALIQSRCSAAWWSLLTEPEWN